ncbi:ABC transporter substrate-binding protein [Paenibacillus puerhi]|uniref:ABC transporter substrate-binding protein n=1 Tax=Paenibacillus puerhi TaxID=2692622 RepID=UPI001356ED1E|nr:extracellular solute-binding protein [Paenibacillus puerhi]
MNKLRWSSFVSLVLAVSVAAGCSQEPAPSSGTPSADGGAEGKPVKIKFHADGISFKKEDLDPIIAKFQEKNPGIQVEFVPLNEASAADNVKKIDLLSASGEQLDAILLPDDRSYAQRAANGLLEPLNELMKKEGLNYGDTYKIDTSIDNNYYGFPGTFRQWFVILNKAHLDEANLPVPKEWTWDEYLEYAKKLTKGEGATKRYGTYFHNWVDYFMLGLWNQPEKNDLVLADHTVNVDNPGVKKSLQIRHQAELIDKSATPYADIISQKLTYRPLYFNQQASMMPIGSWMIGEVGGGSEFTASFKTVFAPMPKNKKEDPNGYSIMSANYVGVVSTSKHKEEAYKFLRFFTTEGIPMMKKYLSSWKKEDTAAALDALINSSKNPEMVDKESLLETLNNSKSITRQMPVSYTEEINKAYSAEFELMLLGKQDVDTAQANSLEKIKKIVSANKK